MGKWELYTEGCVQPLARDIESGEWIGHSEVAAQFVGAHNDDIAALEARIAELQHKRDEWMDRFNGVMGQREQLQRRLDAVVALLEPGDRPCACIDDSFAINCTSKLPQYTCSDKGVHAWCVKAKTHARVKAIAEGRDNG